MTTIQIVRKLLSAAEVGGANTRYDSDTDTVQTTPDGGTTWVDNPALDPRHATTLQLPARTGGDPQCDAAHNMRLQLKKFMDTIIEVSTQGAGASAILGVLVVFMPEVAILWTLALEIMGGLLSIGQSTLNAAFTDGVYDQLECIFYCNIEGDGTVTADDLATIETKIASDIGGVVQAAMEFYLLILGEVGLSNSGAIGADTGDCSGCGCEWCYEFDFTASDGGWSEFTDGTPGATYVPGVGWVDKTTGGTRGTFIQSPIVDLTTFTEIQFDYTALSNVTVTVDYGESGGSNVMNDVCPAALGSFTVTWNGSVDFDRVGLQVGNSTGFAAGSSVISRARYRGTGVNPFGSDNC